MEIGEYAILGCPKCNRRTRQELVRDSIFGTGLFCSECNIVWEADPELETDDEETGIPD